VLSLTARQVREWLERVSLDRPDCHALRKDGLMTYARRMKDDALLSVLRMSLTEFERLPAETRTSSGWKPEIAAITDFEQDREGGEWAEWFDMATVLVVADVRVAAERVGAQARRRAGGDRRRTRSRREAVPSSALSASRGATHVARASPALRARA